MTQRESSYSENVTIDEGFDPHTSVWTRLHFEGDSLITQRTQDMQPVLQHVQAMREENDMLDGGWREGRLVGHLPALDYARITQIKDRRERQAAVRQFFRDKPAFCAYSPYLKR